jgi:hypothetical protein
LALPEWRAWTTVLLVAVPLLLAVTLARISVLSTAYLLEMSFYFGITSLTLGSSWDPRLVSLVLAWALALGVGTLAATSHVPYCERVTRSWQVLGWPHFSLAVGLIALSAYLSLNERAGYAAQVTLGRSTPTGILGSLFSVAPIITLIVLFNSIGSGRRVRSAVGLAFVQIVVLALSGFRGAAGVFIVSIVVGGALTLPHDSPWRSRSRLSVMAPTLVLLTVVTFIVGAEVKNAAANRAGVSSAGTQLFSRNNAIKNTATRLELASYLETGIEHRGEENAVKAVSWETQLRAGIPRFLWPGKPDVDYGEKVSASIYGLDYGRSSSTVTTIGDCFLNFGRLGILVAGLLLGYAFRRIHVTVLRGRGAPSLLLGVVATYSFAGQESPLVLSLVETVRVWLIAGALWAATTLIARLGSSRHPSGTRTRPSGRALTRPPVS